MRTLIVSASKLIGPCASYARNSMEGRTTPPGGVDCVSHAGITKGLRIVNKIILNIAG